MQARKPIALITGGSRGIGLAIARRLAREGFCPALCARPSETLEQAAKAVGGIAVPADLREPEAPETVFAAAEKHGEVAVIVNNAGTAPSAKLEDTHDEMVDEVLDLHVKAPLRLVRAALPTMKQRGSGVIVQLASTAGLRAFPFVSAYVMAKHAMVGLTRALATELRPDLRTYAICPGFVDTDITQSAAAAIAERSRRPLPAVLEQFAQMNRIGRLHTADEVAEAVARVVDPESAPASGTVIDLDSE